MKASFLPYVIIAVIMNVALASLFTIYIILPVQLGPIVGPMYVGGHGYVWVWLLITAVLLLVLAAVFRKAFYLSVSLYTLGLLIWYGSASVFFMLLA